MESNPEDLRGKQSRWHEDIKDEVFHSDRHITLTRINDKVSNMKRQWKEAKVMQESTGWGIREDQESIDKALEKKCPFFHRLDAIWGTRPNVKIIARPDSTQLTNTPLDTSTTPMSRGRAPS